MDKIILGDKYTSTPVLDIGNQEGRTSYIDFIEQKDVKYPVMRGVDRNKRPFIVLRAIDKNGQYYMQTFFQRYSDDEKHWMGCGHGGKQIIDTCGGMKPIQFDLLKCLIQGETCNVTEEYHPEYGNPIDQLRLCAPEEI